MRYRFGVGLAFSPLGMRAEIRFRTESKHRQSRGASKAKSSLLLFICMNFVDANPVLVGSASPRQYALLARLLK
jgi:hypothetical protein